MALDNSENRRKRPYRPPAVKTLTLEKLPALLMVTCTGMNEEFCATCGNCRPRGACPQDPLDC